MSRYCGEVFFRFFQRQELYRTQQRGKTPFRFFINSVLESADELS
jgi:hypothetical protein